MQRTTNPLPKHPSYGNRPTPTLQLLSKLAKFNGERKDIIGRTPKDIIELVKGNESVPVGSLIVQLILMTLYPLLV